MLAKGHTDADLYVCGEGKGGDPCADPPVTSAGQRRQLGLSLRKCKLGSKLLLQLSHEDSLRAFTEAPLCPPSRGGLQAWPSPGPALPCKLSLMPRCSPPGLCSQTPPTHFLQHHLLCPALPGRPLTFPARAQGAELGEVLQMLLPAFVLLFRAALPSWPRASPSILFQSPMRPGTARESAQDTQG